MSANGLYAFDLAGGDDASTLSGRLIGKLLPDAVKTDCRAMCVGPDGTVWAGVAAQVADRSRLPQEQRDAGLRLVSYSPVDDAPVDHGRVVIANPDYTTFTGDDGKPLKWHHGVQRLKDNRLAPRYHIMAICAARGGTVYFTTICPLTLHAWKPEWK